MSRAVMLPVRPRWCELIASGKKTVEVRKTRPKLATPFKVYIYQTRRPWVFHWLRAFGLDDLVDKLARGFGKIIGEFVCDKISMEIVGYINHLPGYHSLLNGSCLSLDALMDYGCGSILYGWHISALQIYDRPRELREFYRICPSYHANFGICWECNNAVGEECDCGTNGKFYLTRPPQSWGYVEELT